MGFFASDSVCPVPLHFEIDSPCISIIDSSGDHVHSVDSFYKRWWETSRKEVDKSVFMSDFADGDLVLELGNVVS